VRLTVRRSPTKRALATALLALALLAFAPAAAHAGGGLSSGGGDGSRGGKVHPSDIRGVSRSYAKFTAILVGKTGLSPRVVAGWTLAEGGPKDNPLNIGPGRRYGTVGKGARATAKNLRTDLYRGIMRSVKRADRRQIDAIVSSPWCPGCKGYRKLLRSTYRRVSVDG
jgi:hypothetical protein